MKVDLLAQMTRYPPRATRTVAPRPSAICLVCPAPAMYESPGPEADDPPPVAAGAGAAAEPSMEAGIVAVGY